MRLFLVIQMLLLFSNINFGQSNYSGLYTRLFAELDLKSNDSLTYYTGSGCGPPFFFTNGTWRKVNDSTLTLYFIKDSSNHEYKIISDTEIAESNSKAFFSMTDKKGITNNYSYYPKSFIRVKGYYLNGKTEWEVQDKWENDYGQQRLVGKCVYYFATGQIKFRGYIKNGRREKKWIYYDISGHKVKAEIYKNNVITREKNYD